MLHFALHILYYDETVFVTPHYQSICPRPLASSTSTTQPSNVRPTPNSLVFSRLSNQVQKEIEKTIQNNSTMKGRKRKCQSKFENAEIQNNSTDTSSSVYGNSQESTEICDSNAVYGKRARSTRKK